MSKKQSAKQPPLPKKLYARWYDDDGIENRFLKTEIEATDHVESGQTVKVGIYELVGTATVKNESKVLED